MKKNVFVPHTMWFILVTYAECHSRQAHVFHSEAQKVKQSDPLLQTKKTKHIHFKAPDAAFRPTLGLLAF